MSGNIRLPLENIEDAETRKADLERRAQTATAAVLSKGKRPSILDRFISKFRPGRGASD